MAEDWAADVKRYHPEADDDVIGGIVRYCGIALRNRDSALVSFSDAKETGRVRDNFLKKKLGLAHPDSELDSAIAEVGERMKGDTTKNRVTVYYLLSDRFAAHDSFRRKAAAKKPSLAAAPPAEPIATVAKKAKAAPRAAKPVATPAKAAAAKPARAPSARKSPSAAPPVSLAQVPVEPASIPLPAASPAAAPVTDGGKLGFGRYEAGKHGAAGTGWLVGAVVVAAVLLVLGLVA